MKTTNEKAIKMMELVKKDARTIEGLQQLLQEKVSEAQRLGKEYKDLKSEEAELIEKRDKLQERLNDEDIGEVDITTVYTNETASNHARCRFVMNNIDALQERIDKIEDIVQRVIESIDTLNSEIESLTNATNNKVVDLTKDQDLMHAIECINNFGQSQLCEDVRASLDMLDQIIFDDEYGDIEDDDTDEEDEEEEDDSTDDEEVEESEAEDVEEDDDDYVPAYTEVSNNDDDSVDEVITADEEEVVEEPKKKLSKKEILEQCPMMKNPAGISELLCESECQYSDECPVANCEVDGYAACCDCQWKKKCIIALFDEFDEDSDGETETEDAPQESATVSDDLFSDDDDDEVVEHNSFDDIDDKYSAENQPAIAPLVKTAIEMNRAVETSIASVFSVDKNTLDNNNKRFRIQINRLKNMAQCMANLDEDTMPSVYSFYSDMYSDTIDEMLGDGTNDIDKIFLISEEDNMFDMDNVTNLTNAVDALTDDLITDEPEGKTFKFDMTGDLKVVSEEGMGEISEKFFKDYHKEALAFINANKDKLEQVLYSINFRVFAENDINGFLQSWGHPGYYEDDYYTIPLPAVILDLYQNLFAKPQGQTGYQHITQMYNVMNQFNYRIKQPITEKYINSHILSALPMETMIYKNTIENDRFSMHDTISNDNIDTDSIMAVGYNTLIITGMIREELSEIIPEYGTMLDRFLTTDTNKSFKDDVAELVFQIWFNQICKLLFNNNVSKIDNKDTIPYGPSALIMDTEPICNLDNALVSHFRPIEVLIATDMHYTTELFSINGRVAKNYNIVHTIGNILMIEEGADVSNMIYGNRLDFDCIYKLALTVNELCEEAEQLKKKEQKKTDDDIEDDNDDNDDYDGKTIIDCTK